MTVVVGWDKGIVRPPSRWNQLLFRMNSRENWPLLAIPFTISFMAGLWYRKGKDPSTGDPLVVVYSPPEERGRPILPAEAGTLIDERLDPRDLTASVVNLAVKRHITITEEKIRGLLFDKTDYLLRKEKEPGPSLPLFERLLLERLLEGHGSEVRISDLKLKFYKNLEDLRKAEFEGLEEMRNFAANLLSVKSAYVRAGAIIIGAGLFAGWLLQKIRGGESILFPLSVAISGGIVILFPGSCRSKRSRGRRR